VRCSRFSKWWDGVEKGVQRLAGFLFKRCLFSSDRNKSNKNSGNRIDMYARKSYGSNVESYKLKYCAPSIPKQTATNRTNVFLGKKKRVHRLSVLSRNGRNKNVQDCPILHHRAPPSQGQEGSSALYASPIPATLTTTHVMSLSCSLPLVKITPPLTKHKPGKTKAPARCQGFWIVGYMLHQFYFTCIASMST